MLVNLGPSHQSSKEEYKPWKGGASARYNTSRTKTYATNEEVRAKIQQAIGPHEDHSKETQTEVARSCFPFIRSGQNHLARHSERGKKTRQTEEEAGKQHQGKLVSELVL